MQVGRTRVFGLLRSKSGVSCYMYLGLVGLVDDSTVNFGQELKGWNKLLWRCPLHTVNKRIDFVCLFSNVGVHQNLLLL
jgi:hypothetical protein